jgi:hypothetical protein
MMSQYESFHTSRQLDVKPLTSRREDVTVTYGKFPVAGTQTDGNHLFWGSPREAPQPCLAHSYHIPSYSI